MRRTVGRVGSQRGRPNAGRTITWRVREAMELVQRVGCIARLARFDRRPVAALAAVAVARVGLGSCGLRRLLQIRKFRLRCCAIVLSMIAALRFVVLGEVDRVTATLRSFTCIARTASPQGMSHNRSDHNCADEPFHVSRSFLVLEYASGLPRKLSIRN